MYFLLFTCSCIHQCVFLKCKMGKLKCFTYAKRTALLAAIICEDPHFSENMNIQGLVLTLEQISSQCRMTVSWTRSSKLHVAMHYSKMLWLEIMIHGSVQFISTIILHQDKAYVWFRLLWAGSANHPVGKEGSWEEGKLTSLWQFWHRGEETRPWAIIRVKRNIRKDIQSLSYDLACLFGEEQICEVNTLLCTLYICMQGTIF